MSLLLDTNILLRDAFGDDPICHTVRSCLGRAVRQGWTLTVSNQNLFEFWVVTTRPRDVNGLGLSPTEAHRAIESALYKFAYVPDPPDLLDRWLELCVRYSVKGRPAHDARLVAVMLAHGMNRILTLNPGDFARYAGVACRAPGDV